MIPDSGSFHFEYAKRCDQLMECTTEVAYQKELLETYSILMASSILVVPWERMNSNPISNDQNGVDKTSAKALAGLKREKFLQSPLVLEDKGMTWKKGQIVRNIRETNSWENKRGEHPFASENSIDKASVERVFGILRNSLSHGNIIYLNDQGREVPQQLVKQLAFVSIDSECAKKMYKLDKSKRNYELARYDVLFTNAESLLCLIKQWVDWLNRNANDDRGLTFDITSMAAA